MTSPTLARAARRIGKPLLVLLVVSALAVPVVQAANALSVNIDGETRTVLSFHETVGDLLESEGVVIAAGDEILPAPDTPLEEVEAVTVLRSIEVDVAIDGRATSYTGTWRTVDGLLTDLGIDVQPAQILRPAARTSLEDGDRVTITSPTTVSVVADGATEQLETHLETVGDVLDVTGTELGEQDLLEPGRDVGLSDGMSIVVQRVEFEEVTEEVALPYAKETRETSELFTDQSRVVQDGEEGLRIDTYRRKLVDGEPAERELVTEEVTRDPVTRIVEVGTTSRPPPKPKSPPKPSANTGSADNGSVWYDLARCESGGRWSLNTGTYDGGLQFHPSTWSANKPSGYPEYAYQASPAQQIAVAKTLQARAGWGQWPSCASQLGLR